ncbi:hypothetical protein [Nonomuraea sp. NPDC050643]|uniref:hypothetical protein n=1 Tax=Nonomuraea sp. NPDC050643 TaxID=3155660 RepID=UPI0033E16B0E
MNVETRLQVVARPSVLEVAVLHLPAGSVAVVEHLFGVREYETPLPDIEWWAVVPGNRDAIAWGAVPCWYGSLRGVRNGRLRLDRDAWHEAARLLRSAPVVYVAYEQVRHYGSWRWTAVSASVAGLAEKAGASA